MADQNLENMHELRGKIVGIQGFLELLITNPLTDFQSSRLSIQYGGLESENMLITMKLCIYGVSRSLITNLWLKFRNLL